MSKSKSKKAADEKLLTDTELELMTILWKLGEGSVADVINGLKAGRDLAYTSVSTILRILEQKKILKTRKEGRGHIYIPAIDKAEYEAKTVKHMVSRVFDGTPTALVKQLVSSVPMDSKQIEELRKIINEAGSKAASRLGNKK
jgi:predicted transcriptional regulator